MNPIIKWTGGKSKEIYQFEKYIPEHERYIEPFFGGGALFFHLMPKNAVINDVSKPLMEFYGLVKTQNKELYRLLMAYDNSFQQLLVLFRREKNTLLDIFYLMKNGSIDKFETHNKIQELVLSNKDEIFSAFEENLVMNSEEFLSYLCDMTVNKFCRTLAHYNKETFSDEELLENLVTGFASGYYMYFRKVYNDIVLGKMKNCSPAYQAANYYFIREYCYGSMFRYNAKGEFNIPYGGLSYNRKRMLPKIQNMFSQETEMLFANTELFCLDFDTFFKKISLTENDFIFLDPPYDSEFSDYEGRAFSRFDQERLARFLRRTSAKFILVIKDTEFIRGLYEEKTGNSCFYVSRFDKTYTYNMRNRNNKATEHLIITNFPISDENKKETDLAKTA